MQHDRPIPPGLPAIEPPPAPRVSADAIDELGSRVRVIRDSVIRTSRAHGDVDVLMEELSVAEEELRVQHDEVVRVNALLAAEQRRYRELFDLAPDAYLVTDLAGGIDEANVAASTLLAVDPARLRRKPLISYVVEPGRRAFRHRLDAIASSGTQASMHLVLRGRGQRLVDIDAHIAPVMQSDAQCVGFRWLLRDVTLERAAQRENERLQAVLEQAVTERTAALRAALAELRVVHQAEALASQRKSEFLAFLSHEVRTPLQAIIGYSELLSLEVHGPLLPAQRSDVDRMQRGQQHILRLLDQLLDYARIESGRVELSIGPVPLSEVCDMALDLVRPHAERAGVTIECDTGGLVARADAEKSRQIVMNLLTNALKFGPPGETVRVSAWRDRDDVVLAVADRGTPIAAELRELIFEPYVHPERSSEGSGLGLPISRRLARAMRGDLTLSDDGVEGNRFELRLPAG
ncbi:MAG: sensor signal transduction histidine kinase [Gemmatimonadetes bacterium]|jgi:PAS domain S-box-containing protein|nr:sensor signal transduction histidine kinase [Gemmatimonadota bacterium]